jgi:hypothetical protein
LREVQILISAAWQEKTKQATAQKQAMDILMAGKYPIAAVGVHNPIFHR